jgi:autotransporter-associated beta strand protein
MKTLILTAIRCSLIFLVPSVTYAISAQWDLNPSSGDWNTAANWTPMTIPNGPADTATFGLSNMTDVSISEDTELNGIIFTPAATNPYSITLSSNVTPGVTLTLSGTGITNNSGITQSFRLFGSSDERAEMLFTNSASAGNSRIVIEGGSMEFFDRSTAGSATIFTDFADIFFGNNSSAGSAFIGVTEPSRLQFGGTSTAGSAFIGATGSIEFFESSSAGRATINSAGFLSFNGSSTGGTSQIQLVSIPDLFLIGTLDISAHNLPGITIGSLEGDENTFVSLGANNLSVGSNNLSTTFAGVIQNSFGGTGSGSLTKIGSGTLILTGANTYTGDTNVNRGVLQVDGSITSNTFVNHGGTLAGTGTINGNVTNSGKVSPGDSPGVLTVAGNYTQTQYAALMIQIAGVSTDQFSVLNVLGNANLNGFLDPVLLNGFVPSIGDSFTFLNYASLTGEFSRIQHQIFDNGMLQWSVIYEANHAILTVEQHVPDPGSTFLLLTLGLFGLVTFPRQLLRGQP